MSGEREMCSAARDIFSAMPWMERLKCEESQAVDDSLEDALRDLERLVTSVRTGRHS